MHRFYFFRLCVDTVTKLSASDFSIWFSLNGHLIVYVTIVSVTISAKCVHIAVLEYLKHYLQNSTTNTMIVI